MLNMTYEEGASFPVAHFTAVQDLYMRLNAPKPFSRPVSGSKSNAKEIILIWDGSTAIGRHANSLTFQASGSSPAAHNYLKALGVERHFDYKAKDIVQQIASRSISLLETRASFTGSIPS